MKLALLGYGKMGREIETIARARGHEIGLKVSAGNADFDSTELVGHDAAIEFSRPESAVDNIRKCFQANVPVIVGTTGWYDHFDALTQECSDEKQTLFHATNFSIGVNLFFQLNRKLASVMNDYPEYDVTMEEIHHTQKLDSPSGTAITLAEGLLAELDRKESWVEERPATEASEVHIAAQRIADTPGTHAVRYQSAIDDIEIRHVAHNRKGFATGAVIAAEWVQGKTGTYSMNDLLNLNF